MDFLLTRIPLLGLWPQLAVLDGVQVPIRCSPLSPGTRRRLMRGGYETAERHVVAQLLDQGDQVLELGASIGILSSILWKRVGPLGRVLSVEANPALRPHFERQMIANGLHGEWVEAVCCPVWGNSVPGSVRLQGFLAGSDNLVGSVGQIDATAEQGCTWRTAEEICNQYRMEPTAIVIDIEGSESVWCVAAPHFPPSVKTVIVEIHPSLIGAARAGVCVQALIEEGFRIVAVYGTVFGFSRRPPR